MQKMCLKAIWEADKTQYDDIVLNVTVLLLLLFRHQKVPVLRTIPRLTPFYVILDF